MHEAHHVADAVECRHLLLDAALFVVEDLHGVREVQVVGYGVGLVGELGLEVFAHGQSVGDVLDEVGDDVAALVDPRLVACPMAVEVALHLLHLLLGGSLGMFLHARVEGGVDLQAAVVEVVAVVLAPLLEMLGDGLAEVESLAVVVLLDAIVEQDGFLAKGVVAGFRQVAALHHVAQHQIATLQAVVGMRDGVVGRCGLEHSHEHGSLFQLEVLRRGVEVGLAGRLDAEGIRAEVDGVGIHRQNLFLRIEVLELERHQPLLGLRDEHAHAGNAAQRTAGILRAHLEHVLCQLLRDGGGSTGIVMQNGVLGGGKHADGVDAEVAVEAFVLRVDEHAPEVGVHLLVFHRSAVLAEVLAYHHAVGTIDFGGLADLRLQS